MRPGDRCPAMCRYGYNDVFDDPKMGWSRYSHSIRVSVINRRVSASLVRPHAQRGTHTCLFALVGFVGLADGFAPALGRSAFQLRCLLLVGCFPLGGVHLCNLLLQHACLHSFGRISARPNGVTWPCTSQPCNALVSTGAILVSIVSNYGCLARS